MHRTGYHPDTRAENSLDKHWDQKISRKPTKVLENGDRIFFVLLGGRGYCKWKSELGLVRATDVEMNNGLRKSNSVDIYNIKTHQYTSMDRSDIRLYRKTKVDHHLMLDVIWYTNQLKQYMETSSWHEETPDFKHWLHQEGTYKRDLTINGQYHHPKITHNHN